MTGQSNRSGPSRDWLIRMSKVEELCPSVSVGGLACDLGLLDAPATDLHGFFGRLIGLARRGKSLSVEQLAEKADVELSEIVRIETDSAYMTGRRAVIQLANALELPERGLMQLAGLRTPSAKLVKEATKFVARSESTDWLTDVERAAFDEFVKVLRRPV